MTVAEALVAIRASTLHDADTQVTDAQLTVKLDQEFRRLRRQLAAHVPSLFEATATATITAGNNTIAKPATFERVRLLERLIASARYYVVPLMDRLNANQSGTLNFYEQAANIVIQPPEAAPGDYRLTFQTKPATGYTSFDVPEGLEDVFIERCAAWVRVRHEEDPTPHIALANDVWTEQRRVLKKRYGAHPVPGLQRTGLNGRWW
jgi:hypothetical protein